MKLYTITELARILNIPPSTAGYYIKRHILYIVCTGSGRKKRYQEQALEILKVIVANRDKTTEEINEILSKSFDMNIEVKEDKQEALATTTATTTIQQQQKLLDILVNISDQTDELKKLRKEVKQIRKIKKEVDQLKKDIKNNRLPWWQRIKQRKQE